MKELVPEFSEDPSSIDMTKLAMVSKREDQYLYHHK